MDQSIRCIGGRCVDECAVQEKERRGRVGTAVDERASTQHNWACSIQKCFWSESNPLQHYSSFLHTQKIEVTRTNKLEYDALEGYTVSRDRNGEYWAGFAIGSEGGNSVNNCGAGSGCDESRMSNGECGAQLRICTWRKEECDGLRRVCEVGIGQAIEHICQTCTWNE